MFEERRQWGRQ